MHSIDHESSTPLPATSSPTGDEQRASRGIVPIYILAVIVAMASWLYLLGGILLLCIWAFADLAASVAFR